MSKKFSGGRRISIRPTWPIFSTPMSVKFAHVISDGEISESVTISLVERWQSCRRSPSRHALAQAQSARDDAAQHLGGAALNGEFRRGLDREGQLILQRFVVGGVLGR